MVEKELVGIQSGLALCICTYKRPQLLGLLLQDVLEQSVLPGILVIVDGDPSSGQVLDILQGLSFPNDTRVWFIPSNHSNLSYQRYLGWLAVQDEKLSFFLYLDDDLRLKDKEAISRVVKPLTWEHEKIVGVTAETESGDPVKLSEQKILVDRINHGSRNIPLLVRYLGAGKDIPPGGLSPSGHRKAPLPNEHGYAEVRWLQGRVMAYSFSALTSGCFSEDLFAITAIHCGLGEDTFLSTRVGISGKMMYIFRAGFAHPDDALPNSYPIDAYRLGYATAYSRRILNDNYRPGHLPTAWDRYGLAKSYLGTMLINWWNVLNSFQQHRLAYAWGYTLGALRGLVQKPTAKHLTPKINWRADARAAMSQMVFLQ